MTALTATLRGRVSLPPVAPEAPGISSPTKVPLSNELLADPVFTVWV